jgi:hypothetical protein
MSNLSQLLDDTNIRPTLFIGLGGTGSEVLCRLRRKILNTAWGGSGEKTRLKSLADFPIAQFIHFDLNQHGQEEPKFSDDEKIIEPLNMDKYLFDDNALDAYPVIKEWLPLTPLQIRDFAIDTSRGAGQIRAISRLYFYDKYTTIRDKIRLKLNDLKGDLSNRQQLKNLGLKIETGGKFRIVIVCSVAGGTGSGAFLDMGRLARWLGEGSDVELMLLLPTGYSGVNKDRTEANGYAALMELEDAMNGNKQYVEPWDMYDIPTLPTYPFTEVYLLDTGNLAQQHTKKVADIYQMLSETLFEDFANGDLARKKRTVRVNQQQHKIGNFYARVNTSRFEGMKLSYSKVYSALGQSSLDTRLEAKRDLEAHVWSMAMLRAFFEIDSKDVSLNSESRSAVLEIISQLELQIVKLQEDLQKDCPPMLYVLPIERTVSLPSEDKLRQWAEEVFRDFGGYQKILKALQEPEEIKKILLSIRHMAEHKIYAEYQAANNHSDVDPLIEALENMAPDTLGDLFTDFLNRAMPWVEADFSNFEPKADQYKCFVGVPNDAEFKKRFESALNDCKPIRLSSINIVSTGVAGRAVCYVEFSGMPLTALRGLEGWRTSYRKESRLFPLHTHKDSTQFAHPIAPNPSELNKLAGDFKYFLWAVMLGVLTRVKQLTLPTGQYRCEVNRGGDWRRIGNESSIRKDGLPVQFHEMIVHQTQGRLAELDAFSLLALSVICDHYEKYVYPAKVVMTDYGSEIESKGFSTLISHEAAVAALEKAIQKGLAESNVEKYKKILRSRLSDWTENIPNSDEDAYSWEINEAEDNLPHLKIAFKAEYLEAGKIEALINLA